VASLFVESMIDYTYPLNPHFKVYPEFQATSFKPFVDAYLEAEMGEGRKVDSEDAAIFEDHMKRMVLIQHLLWACWCVGMMPEEELKGEPGFYLMYAKARFELFQQHREQFKL